MRIFRALLDNLRQRVVYRITIPFTLIIVVGVSIALPYGVTTTARLMQSYADDRVLTTAGVVRNIIRKEMEKLQTFCEIKIYSQPIQEAINRRDITELRRLIVPVRARSRMDIVVVFDREGNEIIRFDEHRYLGANLRGYKVVRNGLIGMRYQDIINTPNRIILCAIAPNETAAVQGGMNGAMLVGQVVSNQFMTEIKETTGADLVISNPDGTVMASTTSGSSHDFAPLLDLQAAAAGLATALGTHVLDTLRMGKSVYRVAHESLILHQEPRAIISVIRDISEIEGHKVRTTQVMILLMVTGVGAALILSFWIARTISRPIRELVRVTEAVAGGDLTPKVVGVTSDEIGRLSSSFNLMIDRIRGDIKEIEEARNKAQQYSRDLEEINRELKKTRGDLVQASKMVAMGQLGAGVAHELNQPLLAIGLFAEQTLKHTPSDSQDHRNLERIIGQTNRMSQIINEIRLFARQSLLEPAEVNVNSPIKRALGLIDRQLADANIEVVLDLQEGIAPVMGDDNQLQQVFLNLFTNARDAILPKGKGRIVVTSRSQGEGQYAAVDFADDGIGIPSELISEIFLPFFTTKKDTKGLGLGLSISYGIIQRHSGTISVTSRPGQGATFRILLPTVLAKKCWEVVDCRVCRASGERDSCPVYVKDQGHFCWIYFQRSGEDEQFDIHCQKCFFYQKMHKLMSHGGITV